MTLKKIGQILTTIVYTPIYIGILYLAASLPLSWILSLSIWKMIFILFFLGLIIYGISIAVVALGIIPYRWIVKDNRIAYGLSISLNILLTILYIINLWIISLDYGNRGIFAAILITGLILKFVYESIFALYIFFYKAE